MGRLRVDRCNRLHRMSDMRSSRLPHCISQLGPRLILKLLDRQPRLIRQLSGYRWQAGSCLANCSVRKPMVNRALVSACFASVGRWTLPASMKMGHRWPNATEEQAAAWIELQVRAQIPATGLRAGAPALHTSFQHSQPMLRSRQKRKAGVPVNEDARGFAPRIAQVSAQVSAAPKSQLRPSLSCAQVSAAEPRTPGWQTELYERPINSATGTIVRAANVTV